MKEQLQMLLTGLLIAYIVMFIPASVIIDSRDYIPASNANHGQTLEEVISEIKNEEYEYTAMFCGTSKLFEVTDYNPHYTTFSDFNIPDGSITVHNHPAGGTYSINDLMMLCRPDCYGITESIIVSVDSMHYLKAPNGWPSQEELASFILQRYHLEVVPYGDGWAFAGAKLAFQRFYSYGYAIPTNMSCISQPKLISEIADHFGLIYVVKPLDAVEDLGA